MAKIKKMLAVLICAAMVLATVPCASFAAEIIDSGTCGDVLTWTLDSNGVLTISGEGKMKNWSRSSAAIYPQWYSYRSRITSIVIENGVTSIGNWAFRDCTSLTSVTIPAGVTSIGKSAFWNCESLASVAIPDSVTNVGSYAFRGCEGLAGMTISDSVTSIGGGAFCGCISLTSIDVAEGNENYISIDGVLFDKAVTELIQYPAGKTESNYNIPDSVTSIGEYTFYNCVSLTSVKIPADVTSIGEGAFEDCTSLTSVNIPDNVTNIGQSAFYNTALYNSSDNWDNGILYIDKALINSDSDSVSGDIEIREGTKVIADSAFEYCESLTSVTIPDSVTNIDCEVFSYCTSLTRITIPDSVTSIGDVAFYDCTSLTSITIPDSVTSIGEEAFYGCTSLTSVTIGDGVTSIGKWAFSDTALYSNSDNWDNDILYIDNALIEADSDSVSGDVEIKKETKIIAHGAFDWCESLTSVAIPDSVTSIGRAAFEGCDNLIDVYYTGTEKQWNEIEIAEYNDPLTDAAIHCSEVSTEPEITSVSADIDGENVSVTAEIENASDAEIFAVGFGADGEKKAISELADGKATLPADGVKTVKVFVWESIESLRPLCEVKEVTVK